MENISQELERFNQFSDDKEITEYLKTLDIETLARFACKQFMRAENYEFNNYSDL